MTTPRRALTVRTSLANLRTSPGPFEAEYALPLDLPVPYRFAVGSVLTDDGRAVVGCSDSSGAWLRLREDDLGADLTGTASLTVGDGGWRRISAAALSANATLTLSTVNATAGDRIEVTRLDVGAWTVAFVNGGPAAGTLVTMPVSARAHVVAQFDGTDWVLRSSGLML